MLPQTTSDEDRTRAFSAYNVVGQAIGAVDSGAAAVPALLGAEPLTGYRALMWADAAAGLVLALLVARLSIESKPRHARTAAGVGSPSALHAGPF